MSFKEHLRTLSAESQWARQRVDMRQHLSADQRAKAIRMIEKAAKYGQFRVRVDYENDGLIICEELQRSLEDDGYRVDRRTWDSWIRWDEPPEGSAAASMAASVDPSKGRDRLAQDLIAQFKSGMEWGAAVGASGYVLGDELQRYCSSEDFEAARQAVDKFCSDEGIRRTVTKDGAVMYSWED